MPSSEANTELGWNEIETVKEAVRHKGQSDRKENNAHAAILSSNITRKKIQSYFGYLRETTVRKQTFYLEILHLTSAHLGR